MPQCITDISGQTSAPFGRLIFDTLDGFAIAPMICQELWSRPEMCKYLLQNQCDFIFSGNGSCYNWQKIGSRMNLLNPMTIDRGIVVYSNVKGNYLFIFINNI